MSTTITWPTAPCCMDEDDLCVCPKHERALRAFMDRQLKTPMTPEQREYCLTEIDRIEGYDRAQHIDSSDASLARTTLCAWTDYARDKGLL